MVVELYLYVSPAKRIGWRFLSHILPVKHTSCFLSYVEPKHPPTPEERLEIIQELLDIKKHIRSMPEYSRTFVPNAVKGYIAIVEYPTGKPCLNITCVNEEMCENIETFLEDYLLHEKKAKEVEFTEYISDIPQCYDLVEIYPLVYFYYTFPSKKL